MTYACPDGMWCRAVKLDVNFLLSVYSTHMSMNVWSDRGLEEQCLPGVICVNLTAETFVQTVFIGTKQPADCTDVSWELACTRMPCVWECCVSVFVIISLSFLVPCHHGKFMR